MSAQSSTPDRTINPRRAEQVAIAGLVLQVVVAILVAVLADSTGSRALSYLNAQIAVGIFVWVLTWVHLHLHRAAREELDEVAQAEQRRKQQGIGALFDDPEQGLAQRNLDHMDRWIAPAASVVMALGLLGPVWYHMYTWIADGTGLETVLTNWPALEPHANIYIVMIFLFGMAFANLLLGAYGAGLARQKGLGLLRAGAGYGMSSAALLALCAIAMGVSKRGWLQEFPDLVAASVVVLSMTLQAIEVLANFIFDFYRPRIAGVETRPAYDSRLSGIFAEPQGLFHTFAHTMDYQFGFKISETWFFQFLEKAFAPLILAQLLTFYLLTCFVVVRPGEVAIVEYWGAPRGVSALPQDDAAWDTLQAPLAPSLHLKLPWPIETARVLAREQIQTLTIGFEADTPAEAEVKALELRYKTTSWDKEHIVDEYKYLMPLPDEMRAARQDLAEVAAIPGGRAARPPDNALFLSGTFSVEYRVGDRPGDPYRYVYKHKDVAETLRVVFEREVTSYLAGANFWDVMLRNPEQTGPEITRRFQAAADAEALGVRILTVNIQNVHPPAGAVGKSYQEVLKARQKARELVYGGEIAQREILGLIEGQQREVLDMAEAYRYRARVIAEAEAERFRSQLKADSTAPEVYRHRLRMASIERALRQADVILHPPGIEVRLDQSKLPSIEELKMTQEIVEEVKNTGEY